MRAPMFTRGARSLFIRAALALVLAAPALAQSTVPSGFGREGTVKVRVPRAAAAPALAGSGARLVAEYESFSIVEVPAGAAVPAGAEVLVDENRILLNAGALDTSTAAVKQLQAPRGNFEGRTLHLVQFAGPIQPAWFDQLSLTGVRIVTYIPSNAYLVYGDAAQIANLQGMAAASPQVQWNGAYRDEYKIDPTAVALMNNGAKAAAMNEMFSIQLVEDAAPNAATLAVIARVQAAPIVQTYTFQGYTNIVAVIPPAMLGAVAAQPDVVSIQPWGEPGKFDERQDQIVAGNLSGNLPTGPGYLAWLAGKGFTQAQFTASAFAVDITDSGVDNGTTSPNHFALHESGNLANPSRIVYNRLEGTPHAGSTLKGCDGHGTLNTHIILGYSDLATSPHLDASGYHYSLGVCPFTKVGSSVIFDPSTYTNPNIPNLQADAYNGGARISSNSWGNTSGNTYNTLSQTYDALVRDAQPTGSTFPVVGNQQMVIVFANGNGGPGANTTRPPGTAKNLISVGAAENVQAIGGSDFHCGTPDSGADSANDIIDFSSRGPCSDGRKKPDICAPGTHVSGGVVQANPVATGTGAADACYTGSGVCGGVNSIYFPSAGQQFYTASSGTSHSTPCVSGGCALIRQFFINQGMPVPSPAMTKAVLMNSARYMTGVSAGDSLYSNNQGMGEMNLGEAFNRGPVPTIFRDQDTATDIFTASGQTRVFNGTIADSSKPFRVTLAWTDAPGATTGSAAKNNLDLTVTIGANTYKGNVFTGANSVTGGSADTLNNVESVFLPSGASGTFTVTVTATSINSDGVPNFGGALDQDFALVVYNASQGCVGASVSGQPSPQSACAGSGATFTVTGSGTAPLGYQWRKNTVPIGGATNPSYSILSVSAGDVGNYDCVISNACGSQTSNAVALTVNTAPSISANPSPVAACPGDPFSFSVTASGTPAPTYQWRQNTVIIAGATSSTYGGTASGVFVGSYDCIVTNSCGSVTSTPAPLTLKDPATIQTQPNPQSPCVGQPFSFSVTANGTPPFSYQWRKDGNDILGATSGSYGGTASLADGGSYQCLVSNDCGSDLSNGAALSVGVGPSINSQPSPTSACVGTSFSFSVSASGTPAPAYQWRKDTVPIGGATSSTYGATAASGDAGSYDCVISNSCGSVTSTAAALTVGAAPVINVQPPVSQTVYSGTPATISLTATGATGYQWRKNTVPIGGATASSYSIISAVAADAGTYDCQVSNSCGTITSNGSSLSVLCYPNCDQSITPPVLNVADFTCFLQQYANGDPYANCDGSTNPPVLNVADFTCFLQQYANGCP